MALDRRGQRGHPRFKHVDGHAGFVEDLRMCRTLDLEVRPLAIPDTALRRLHLVQ